MLHPRKTLHFVIPLALGIFILTGAFLSAGTAFALTAAGTNITNQASASYSDSNANSFTANSNSVTTTVNSVYFVQVSTPADQAGQGNTVLYYPYTVTNSGNNANTFALSASSASGWTVALIVDANNDGIHDAGENTTTSSTGSIAKDAIYKFFVKVTIPANTANAVTDVTTLTVTGSADAGTGDNTSDTVTTTCNAPTLAITKAVRNVSASEAWAADPGQTSTTANPGQTLEYRLKVTNTGAIGATVVALTDSLNANTTFVTGSIYIGSNGTAYNGGGNAQKTDNTSGDGTCGTDACGAANHNTGTITAYLGNGATESAGGSLANTSTVYVFFRVTVN